MSKWEYAIATRMRGYGGENYSFTGSNFSNAEDLLNYAGGNGWELAGFHPLVELITQLKLHWMIISIFISNKFANEETYRSYKLPSCK